MERNSGGYLPSRRETKWLRALLWVPTVKFWSASYSTCVVYTKTIIHLSVGESGEIFVTEKPLRGVTKKAIFRYLGKEVKLENEKAFCVT